VADDDLPINVQESIDPKVMAELERRGEAAWERLKSNQSWDDWRQVGFLIDAYTRDAMYISKSNDRIGKAYNLALRPILDAHPWIELIHKTVRTRLQDCIDNLPAIEEWRRTLALSDQMKWNHPTTVLTRWKASRNIPTKKKRVDPRDIQIKDLEKRLEEAEVTIVDQKDELETAAEAQTNLRRELESEKQWHSGDPANTVELQQRVEMAERVKAQAAEETQKAEDEAAAARNHRREVQRESDDRGVEIDRLNAVIKQLTKERDLYRAALAKLEAEKAAAQNGGPIVAALIPPPSVAVPTLPARHLQIPSVPIRLWRR
jgi:hypothetical protein